MRRFRHLAAVSCLLALVACGGGGGGGATTVALPAIAELDGFVADNLFVDANNPIAVGDTDFSWQNVARGFVAFDLSAIPPGATVLSAELRLYQSAITGAPYPSLGVILVDHVLLGDSLLSGDYDAGALTADIGTISTDATLEMKAIPVTAAVGADVLAARLRSCFRLRFQSGSNTNSDDDYAHFNDAEDSEGNGMVPSLLVTYRAP